MIWDLVTGLVGDFVGGVRDHFEHKRKIKEAKTEARLQRLRSKQIHTQRWEIMQIENSGWQDDILFYFFIGLFIWAGIAPESAAEFFQHLGILPDWFVKTWMWIVASVIGVKKIGDYGPRMIEGTGQALKSARDSGLFDKAKEAAQDVADAVTGGDSTGEEDAKSSEGEEDSSKVKSEGHGWGSDVGGEGPRRGGQ